MDESTKRQVILDFELGATEALKRAAELEARIKALRGEQRELDTSTAQGKLEYQRYSAEIKAATAQLRSTQGQITNTVKAQSALSGEVEKQRAKLAALTAEWTHLKKEDADYTARNEALQKAISETTAALKAAEEAHGDHRRSVGDYEKAVVSLKTELRELTEELMRMSAAGQTDSEEFHNLLQRAQELKDAQTDVNSVLSKGADETEKNMIAVGDAIGSVVTAYGFYQAAVGVSAETDSNLARIVKALTIAYSALSIGTKAWVAIQKESAVYANADNLLRKIGIDRVKAQAKAEAALNVVRGGGTVATKAAAAATWAWNAALAANPVVQIVVGVAALGAAVYGLSRAFKDSESAARSAATAYKDYGTVVKATDKTLADIEQSRLDAESEIRIAGRKEIDRLRKQSADRQQIIRAEYAMESNVREASRVALIKSGAAAKQALQDLFRDREALERAARSAVSEKQLDEIREKQDAVNDKIREYTELLNSARRDLNGLEQDKVEAQTQLGKDLADAAYEDAQKALDRKRQVGEAALKAQAGYQSQDFAQRQRYAQRLRELSDRSELERLTLARRYGKMTQAEYEAGLAVLNASMQEFRNAQAREANDYYRQQREAIFSLFDKTAQEQIDAVNEKYRKAYDQLNQQAMHAPDASAYEGGTDNKEYQRAQRAYEDFMYNLASIRARMEEQQQEEIASIEENSLRRRAEKIERQIERQYDRDLRKYQDNERKKLEVTIAQLEAQAAAKQAKELDTYDEDAALAVARRQINQMNLDAELLAAGENARAKYKVRKAYLEKEMELAEGNADRQGEIQAQSLENEREYFTARIDAVGKWSDAAMQAMGAVNDLFNALGEAKLQKAQENYDRESEMLQEQLDQGYISQAEYDRKQQQLDKNLEREQKKIARQQAVREKEMALFKIAVDTAMAIMALWVKPGFPAAIPMAAMIGALGAVQLAAVAAQPLPKAARGRYISGRSHAQGGELVVAEDGEIIMNRNSVRMFGPELSAMSVAGGGVPFHIPDGGYTARYAMSRGLSKADIEDAMMRAVKRVKVYTLVEDIRRGEQNYAQLQTRGQV